MWGSRRNVAKRLLILVGALVVFAMLVRWLEPRLVFFPLRGESRTPADVGIPYEAVDVATEDGETLRAWWLPHPEAAADVIYFHGNGGNLSLWLPVFAGVHAQGLNVLAVDYRGYGASTGSPTEDGLYADARATLARHRTLPGVTRTTIYWGRSLGGPVAAYAATVRPPAALVLEATFPDKAAVVRHNPVMRALNLFARYEFPTLRFLRRARGADGATFPVLVMHGDADSIIPFPLGREIHDAIGEPKRFVAIRGGDHNDFHAPNDVVYWTPVRQLLTNLPASP